MIECGLRSAFLCRARNTVGTLNSAPSLFAQDSEDVFRTIQPYGRVTL